MPDSRKMQFPQFPQLRFGKSGKIVQKSLEKLLGKIVGKIDLKNRESNCKLVLLKMIHCGIICSESI